MPSSGFSDCRAGHLAPRPPPRAPHPGVATPGGDARIHDGSQVKASRKLDCCLRCLRPSSGHGATVTSSTRSSQDARVAPPCADWPECLPVSATAREQHPLEQDHPQAQPREWDAGIQDAIRLVRDEGIPFLMACDGHGAGPAWISFLDVEDAIGAAGVLSPRYAPEVVGLEPRPDGTRDLAVVLRAGVQHEDAGRD